MSKKKDEDVWKLSQADLEAIEKQLHSVTTTNTNTISSSGGILPGSYTYPNPNYFPQTTQPYQYPVTPPSSRISIEMDDPEIVDLIALLEVEPCTPEAQGIILRVNQVDYSLTTILKAQMTYMVRMNLLLIHRGLATEI